VWAGNLSYEAKASKHGEKERNDRGVKTKRQKNLEQEKEKKRAIDGSLMTVGGGLPRGGAEKNSGEGKVRGGGEGEKELLTDPATSKKEGAGKIDSMHTQRNHIQKRNKEGKIEIIILNDFRRVLSRS